MSKKLLFALTMLAGMAAFCAIPFIVGIGDTVGVIGQVGWIGSVLFCLNNVLMLVIPAVGWMLLLREEGHRVPFMSLLKANVLGYPINFFTPSLYLGGEPVKTLYIAGQHNIPRHTVLATIIVNKFQEIGALLLLILASTGVIVFWSGALSLRGQIMLAVAALILLLLFGFIIASFIGNFNPVVRFCKLLIRWNIFKKSLSKLLDKAAELEVMVRDAFVKRWKIFVVSQLITLLSAVSIFLRPAIFFYFFSGGKETISLSDMAVIFALTQLVNIFQLVPGNLGIFEGGMIGLFALIGHGAPEASAFSILGRITDLVLLITGLWFAFHYGLSGAVKKEIQGPGGAEKPPAS